MTPEEFLCIGTKIKLNNKYLPKILIIFPHLILIIVWI